MQIFLFVIDGIPRCRASLAQAQAALEDYLRELPGTSDVWWDDERPYEARRYLYSSSHTDTAVEDAEVDFEVTEKLIWPVELPGDDHTRGPDVQLFSLGAKLSLEVKTDQGKYQLMRAVSQREWSEKRLRPHLVLNFATNAGQALADRLTQNPKERT